MARQQHTIGRRGAFVALGVHTGRENTLNIYVMRLATMLCSELKYLENPYTCKVYK